MKIISCPRCNKKLGLIEYGHIQIKCPRCKYITDQSASSANSGILSNEKTNTNK